MDNFLVSNFLGDILCQIYWEWQRNKNKIVSISDDIFYNLTLNEKKDTVTFNSPICLRLAKIYFLNHEDLAVDFVKFYDKNQFKYYPNLKIYISGNGWLELTVTNQFLEEYLTYLSSYCFNNKYATKNKQPAEFKHIYIYGRFCSILKSAHEHNIITLNSLDLSENSWHILDIKNIKFNNLPYTIDSDLSLIKTLIYCIEITENKQKKINYLSMVEKMYQALMAWEKNCRIWGEVKEKNIDLSRARLGLSAIALRYYHNLCKSVFTDNFPTQL
ncbi:hypothetical protein A5482_000190 [Cyanobacterium sp. IPPAS B-1200]|uniref:hypothetical protein n=1 Tax=Cyanobacterium sp. IPPAS B-1200 TaxID=1562720 RepID=UPI00085289A5|nr:hypothetical protein [Cyanobacterium sp. IPPAS B-1200]OEJ79100.1 hypothetical protein A5482_11195 [Cyanobacterium sp. IPPAS B-1200]